MESGIWRAGSDPGETSDVLISSPQSCLADTSGTPACVAVYLENRRSIDAAVERRVIRDEPETIVVKFLKLTNVPLL